jgi:hypothetical protein
MIKKCPARGLAKFANIYRFLNRNNVVVPAGEPATVKDTMVRFLAAPNAVPLPHVAAAVPAAAAAPPPIEAPCPPGKIRNPKTRKCVKTDGKLGRQIVESIAKAAVIALGVPAAVAAAPIEVPCPPGKIRNPKTRRCVKADGKLGVAVAAAVPAVPAAAAACPPGKILNPATGRCVSVTGAIGRKLVKP